MNSQQYDEGETSQGVLHWWYSWNQMFANVLDILKDNETQVAPAICKKVFHCVWSVWYRIVDKYYYNHMFILDLPYKVQSALQTVELQQQKHQPFVCLTAPCITFSTKKTSTQSLTTLTGHEHDVKLVGSERQCSDVKIADLTSSTIPEPLTLKLETDASREYLGTNATDRFIVDGADLNNCQVDVWFWCNGPKTYHKIQKQCIF